MNNNCVDIDELILEIADHKNDYADMAAEKLFRKCSTSWEAYQYLRDRVHDGWIPNSARAVATDYKKDSSANPSASRIRHMNSHERNFFKCCLSLSFSHRSLYHIF
jgi:hypothetical protein